MRIACALLLLLGLAGCNRGVQNKDAVRQGVLDYFAGHNLNVAAMTVELTSVQFNGNQADVSVSLTTKGGDAAQAMSLVYHMELKDNKWVVVGRKESGQSPHGTAAMPGPGGTPLPPGAENPHGGGAMPPAPGSGSKMPSPEDLPPAGQKK